MTTKQSKKSPLAKCLGWGASFAIVCVVLAILSKAIAESLPVVAIVIWLLFLPTVIVASVIGMSGELSASTFVLVFICQMLFAVFVCRITSLVRSIDSGSDKGPGDKGAG